MLLGGVSDLQDYTEKGCNLFIYSLVAYTPNNYHCFESKSLKLFACSRNALAEAALLAFPNPTASKEFVVDTSAQYIGAVPQEVKDGEHKPLAFWSKALRQGLSASGLLLIVSFMLCYESIRHFHHYMDAKDFILKTDHNPIVHHLHSNSEALIPNQQHLDYVPT